MITVSVNKQPLPPLQAPPPAMQPPNANVNASQMQPQQGGGMLQPQQVPTPGVGPMPQMPQAPAPMQNAPVGNMPPTGYPSQFGG